MSGKRKVVHVGTPCVDCGRPLEWLDLWNDKGVCQPCFHQRNLAPNRAAQACAEAKVLRGGGHYAGDNPPMAERAQQGEYKHDNYLDGTAYFALAGEAASIERKK